jgi:hypothetical protein
MKAENFFKIEQIPIGFEKIPEGMTYIKVSTLDIEVASKDFGDGMKARYKLKFENKKGEKKEYEVGVSVVRGIEKAIPEKTEYLVLTRQGKGKEDTHYTVVAYKEN